MIAVQWFEFATVRFRSTAVQKLYVLCAPQELCVRGLVAVWQMADEAFECIEESLQESRCDLGGVSDFVVSCTGCTGCAGCTPGNDITGIYMPQNASRQVAFL